MLLVKSDGTVVKVYHAQRQLQYAQALLLDVTVDPAALDNSMFDADSIEICLPVFADGRAMSIARHLRTAKGYSGVLRASGAALPDQLQSLFQLGFDEVLVGDVNLARHTEQDWRDAAGRLSEVQTALPSYIEKAGHASIWLQRQE